MEKPLLQKFWKPTLNGLYFLLLSFSLSLSSLPFSPSSSPFQFFVSPVNSLGLSVAVPDILTTNQLSSSDLWWCDLIKHKIYLSELFFFPLFPNQVPCFQSFVKIIRGKYLVSLYLSFGEEKKAEANILQDTVSVQNCFGS